MNQLIVEDLARAVADDTYITRPRRWLAKHDIPNISLAGEKTTGYEILIDDYKHMKAAAKLLKPTFKTVCDGDALTDVELFAGAVSWS